MKNSILFLILLVGIVILGYLLINNNQTNKNNLTFDVNENINNQSSNGNTETDTQTKQTSNTNRQEAFGVSVIPPGNYKISAYQDGKSTSDGATNANVILVPFNKENYSGLVIEKFLSQTDFNKIESDISTRISSNENMVNISNILIDNENAIQYHSKMAVDFDMYEIIIPSKLARIGFILQALSPYNLKDINDVISSIKFD